MNRILFLIEKEFNQLSRNTILLRMMIASPVMQLILLVYAANFEVKNLKISILDHDNSITSQRLAGHFKHIDNFSLQYFLNNEKEADAELLSGRSDLVMVVPTGFDRNLTRENGADLQLLVNAIDGSKAGIASGYAQQIIRNFNEEIKLERGNQQSRNAIAINVENRYWFNPYLEYRTFMVPGVLFELLILVGGMISALNIVREKEIGTQEQLNVTPIRKFEFIIGKLTPFVLIGLLQFTMGLTVGVFLFKIPLVGSILLLYLFAFVFLILCVGLGLFISTVSNTQQQAMFAVFFCLVLFILLSGLFSSTENMPPWAKAVNIFNPLNYIIDAGRNIMLKGSGFSDMLSQFLSLLTLAVIVNGLAAWNYRKTV